MGNCLKFKNSPDPIYPSVNYYEIKNQIQPFDVLLFRGGDFISSAITKVQKLRLGNGSFSHAGLVINGYLLGYDDEDKKDKLYLWEITMSGKLTDGVPDIRGKSFLGVQVRDLDKVVEANLKNPKIKIGWLPLINNPYTRCFNQNIEIKDIILNNEEVIVDNKEVIVDNKEVIIDNKQYEVTVEVDNKEVIVDNEEVIVDHKEVIVDNKEVIVDNKEVIVDNKEVEVTIEVDNKEVIVDNKEVIVDNKEVIVDNKQYEVTVEVDNEEVIVDNKEVIVNNKEVIVDNKQYEITVEVNNEEVIVDNEEVEIQTEVKKSKIDTPELHINTLELLRKRTKELYVSTFETPYEIYCCNLISATFPKLRKISIHENKRFFCSEFVAYILKEVGVLPKNVKEGNVVPVDFIPEVDEDNEIKCCKTPVYLTI